VSDVTRAAKARRWTSLTIGVVLMATAAAAAVLVLRPTDLSVASAGTTAIPAPAVDEPAGSGSETVVLAGGCFWGVQGVYEHVKGVTRAESGYAGGDAKTADYETVSTGTTGHAESVRVTYDPKQVTLGQLLHVFFSVVQDPTELNRQGPDTGTQYRSAIFTQNDAQQRVAEAYIAQLGKAGVFPAPIVTTVTPGAQFFPAEAYHQDFLNSNPTYPYIAINDMPKLDGLKSQFPQLYRDQPVLVLSQTN
jgi:peptide-methionine (S)-S-oxide reductase